MTNPALDRETAIARTFASAFAALDDFRHKNPAAASRVDEVIASHMRSAAPMALIDAGPIAKLAPVCEISRELADGSKYHLEAIATGIYLHWSRYDAALLPLEIIRLRADLEAVASR